MRCFPERCCLPYSENLPTVNRHNLVLFPAYFDENELIHQYNTVTHDRKMIFILMLSSLKLEKVLSNLKVVNCGIICQQILKKYSHTPRSNITSRITYYSL